MWVFWKCFRSAHNRRKVKRLVAACKWADDPRLTALSHNQSALSPDTLS